ncbi:MAG: hypothetical protein A3B23_03445 [Candidatus Colwellbacteria bacterium RIFCSPLOWO2_01_FULL_48_10]|uniref:AAA+ ATPase domain-containing protein n=1 Tax=Candidatus Colwellbacteria bacterium RIFCSPLOWO2_01_FULL_48_10 TaxID=1797690 RepID=A0A1G1Z6K2_9BACT|nr:MAG: hypothetical protein A3B23_03445 [Candidatus Colwellbacteria bacterium RIFCSPLOWO2_01_FULL_48_10]
MHLTQEKLRFILKESGVVNDRVFDSAVGESDADNSVEDVLVRRGDIPEHYFAELIAKYANIPIVDLPGMSISKDVLDLVPESFAQSRHLVIFEHKPGELAKVAMLDPLDYETIEFLRVKLGVWVEPYITTKSGLISALKQYKEVISTEFTKAIKENVEKSLSLTGEADLSKMAEAVSIVAILKSIIEYAITLNASDIHFEPFSKNLVVRFRVDGVLREVFDLPKQVESNLVARVKILANLQIDEHRLPQDGRFKFDVSDKESVDVRVNITPVLYGEKAEMRLLKSSARPLTLEDIGLSKEAIAITLEEIRKPHGMILVTGPTGSGKTTTLYVILHILNTPAVNITTIEDPIEYEVSGINQVQVNAKAGVTFATGLRSILRQDPNIIMIGEIRDPETVNIGVQSALTGHLVLSSLHTNDAPSALPRLLDMGAPAFLLASTVNLVIAQRLVRRICLSCIESYEISPEAVKLINAQLALIGSEAMKKDEVPKTVYRGRGCNICGNSGFKGQIAIFELVRISDAIKTMVLRSAPSGEIRDAAIKEGMTTIFEDGLDKIRRGVTTIEEVLRVIQE